MSKIVTREVLERRNGSAAVVLYDPDRDQTVLIEQFRAGALTQAQGSPWLIEVVTGTRPPEEAWEDLIRREAREEAGCEISQLKLILSCFPSPGMSTEYLKLYCGRVNTEQVGGIFGLKEEQEDIRVFCVSLTKVDELLANGMIQAAPAIMGLQWVLLNRDKLRLEWQS